MGWKTINGRRYYYRSRRVGERVVSEYYGAGEVADLIARLDNLDRIKRETEREGLRCENKVDDLLATLVAEGKSEATSVLTAAGCHHHKGQWRHRRRRRHLDAGAS
ncbi:hypothetical protein [Paludisphaera soli]|uniref:hypothetical protein n=1 Tax=Paludisphaera soli TaxID=2712865 RepID=UPI0013EDBD7E|nr:hypothetical protein [Paludisphaera soli]